MIQGLQLVHLFTAGSWVQEVFDLSQRNPVYFRTELVDSSMLVLKTNTKLYCDDQKHKRTMSAEEVCGCLVMPCNKNFVPCLNRYKAKANNPRAVNLAEARISKGPLFEVDSVPHNAILHLAGNGMHVACAGVLVVIAAIHVQKIKSQT